MTEQDRKSLKKFLAEEGEKYERLKLSQEEVRQELERRARQAIEKYQQECEELAPLAKEKVSTIVQPWFNELVQEGTYDQLLEWLKTHHKRRLSVSDSILYYWPDKAFNGLRSGEQFQKKPFQETANYIVENYRDYQEGVEKHQHGVDEVWSAGFHIGGASSFNNILNYHHGLYISQWPMVGGGYGFAVGRAGRLEIQVNVRDISAAIPSIHPEVWIGFADQVESGKALEVLQDSLIPKPARVVDVGSPDHAKIVREDLERKDGYLRARRARGV